MSLNVMKVKNSKRNDHWLTRIGPAVVVFMLVVSPGFAAGPQPSQPSQPPASQSSQSPQSPSATCPPGGQCFADVPSTNPFYAFINRIYQQDLVSGYACGGLGEPCDAYSRPYYRPVANVTRQQMAKFIDNARHMPGIYIDTSSDIYPLRSTTSASGGVGVWGSGGGAGVLGISGTGVGVRGFSSDSIGVLGRSDSSTGIGVSGFNGVGNGVQGTSTSGTAVYGISDTGPGVDGNSTSNSGVDGYSASGDGVAGFSNSGAGVYGTSTSGWAGYFEGNVNVTGSCCAMGEAYTRIDDPLDPANKYLNQPLVQSPDMIDIYRGHVTLDAEGSAIVQLPPYFEALNRDFDYQLTPVGAPMPNLYVAEEVQGNSFKIAGGKPGSKVSWQVTGTRHDPYAEAHPIQPEQEKPAGEKGKYLHPTELGQPASLGVDYEQQQKMQAAESKP